MLTIAKIKASGINYYHAQVLLLQTWCHDITPEEYAEEMSAWFERCWYSTPEYKETWWTRFKRKHIVDWDPRGGLL